MSLVLLQIKNGPHYRVNPVDMSTKSARRKELAPVKEEPDEESAPSTTLIIMRTSRNRIIMQEQEGGHLDLVEEPTKKAVVVPVVADMIKIDLDLRDAGQQQFLKYFLVTGGSFLISKEE
jgi:hypothetical protein